MNERIVSHRAKLSELEQARPAAFSARATRRDGEKPVPAAPASSAMDDSFPRPFRFRSIRTALILAALALFMVLFTSYTYPPFFAALRCEYLPTNSFLSSAKQFASGGMILAIGATIWFMDHRRRASLLVLLLAIGLSSGINETIKQLAGRARPQYGVIMDRSQRQWIKNYLAKNPGAPLRPVRGDQWLGLRSHRPFFKDGFSSFPSGHANTAFVVAAYLTALYPPAKVVWLTAAGSCAAARVAFRRHYPEDILFGGALGWSVAQLVFSWSWPILLSRRLLRAGKPRPKADAWPHPEG